MPGAITHTAVALLARDRVRQIRDSLRAKERSGRKVNEIERQVRFLAEKAYTAMTNPSPTVAAPVSLFNPTPNVVGGDRVSKFLLMGAVGPDIPGYAAFFGPNQQWLRDTIHKGTPDENRERVVAGSCNLALNFWRKVQPRIDAEFPAGTAGTAEDKRHHDALTGMQAYVLGHFCHVATDLLAAPFLDNLEWQAGNESSREEIAGALDVEVARTIFRRGTETRGNEWIDWYPTADQIPDSFFKASVEALEETYGSGAVRPGTKEYEEARAKKPPVALSEELLRDGYASFRKAIDQSVAWDYWDWLGATWFMFLPSFAAYPLALALPNGKDYFRDTKPAGYDEDKALFELLALPIAANSLVPLYYSIVASTSVLGAESEVIVGWASTGVQIAAAIGYFASLGASADTLPWRYGLLFGLPLAAYATHVVYTLTRSTNPRRAQLLFASIVPVVLSLLFIGLYWAFLHTGIEKMLDADESPGEFIWRLVVWFTILFGLWWLTALILRSLLAPDADERVARQGHHVRLFGDTTLFLDPATQPTPTLADLFYPSGRRALLKLWRDGTGEATVIAHADRLEFDIGGQKQIVSLPPAGMTASELADYLQRKVSGLKAELAFEDHELTPGLAFAEKSEATKLAASTETNDAYIVYHAPKAVQSVRFDRGGPSLDADETTAAVDGIGTVDNDGTRVVTLRPGPNNTKLTRLFRPGDLIEVPQGGSRRVVVSVESDEQLTISTPFPTTQAGATFRRAAQDRRNPAPVPATWTVTTGQASPLDLEGTGGEFGAIFRPGDTIVVKRDDGSSHPRVIREVVSDTKLIVADAFEPPLAASKFERRGQEPETLIPFMAGEDDTLDSGGSIMNHAADLSALLCLAATSQMLSPGELGDRTRVQQVFRNWNLDRRRENEWKMLVLGGAVSEKRGNVQGRDAALPPADPPPPVHTPDGEATANAIGWLNVLRSWVEMARSPRSDTRDTVAFRPGNPTNLELSRAMAFLLDLRDPGATP